MIRDRRNRSYAIPLVAYLFIAYWTLTEQKAFTEKLSVVPQNPVTPVTTGDPKDEYKDLSDNMRHYGNMRFAQLTLFVAMTAGLLNIAFGNNSKAGMMECSLLKILGLLTTHIFSVMDQRAASYWIGFRKRAIHLEKALHYSQYQTSPPRRFFTATNAVKSLFIGVALFWLLSIIVTIVHRHL